MGQRSNEDEAGLPTLVRGAKQQKRNWDSVAIAELQIATLSRIHMLAVADEIIPTLRMVN